MKISQPRGIVPRSKGCDLPPNYAQKAENLNTQSNRFEAWRDPLELLTFPESTCAAHVKECCWTGDSNPYTTYVDAGNPRHTYRSTPGQRPLVTESVCEPDWTYLGYPVPDAPIAVSDLGEPAAKDVNTETRTYVITYGTECEEGPASCPSDPIHVNKDSQVGLAFPQAPSPLWGHTLVRVYQSQPLLDSSQGLVDLQGNPVQPGLLDPSAQQEYFLVAELPAHETRAVLPSLAETPEIGRKITSQDLLPAPQGSQVAGETSLGSLVIFWDNSIAFSERNRHWGFPLKTWHDFPFEVKDVKVCGDTVFVLTCGAVYVIQDSVDCSDSNARPVQEIKGDYTPSHCVACVETPDGILYTGLTGLHRLRLDGSISTVSDRAFDKDSWSELGPIRALTIACGLVILSADQEYLWELRFDETGNLPADLTTLSFSVDQWVVDDQNHLYLLCDNTVYQFNAGNDYLSIDWWQAEQRTADRQRHSALGVDYVNKHTPCYNALSVYRNGQLSVDKEVQDKVKIRSTGTKCFQLRVKGPEPMCSVSYGQGFNDLRE